MKTPEDIIGKYIIKKYVNEPEFDGIKEFVTKENTIDAMKEYAKQEYERGIADGKIIQEHGSTHYFE